MFMQVKGYNHFDSCFLVPFWCDSFSPRDLMHDTLCHGTLEVELCGLLNRMNAYGWLTCNLLNEVILTYSWPEGVHMPLIGEKSLRGNDSGLPTPDANLDMTAHQLLVFVIHSISILGDFVPREELECDIWTSWTLHVTWFLLALSKEFSLDDVRRLDIYIYRHHTLFLSIPDYYDLWIPKFHFVQHIPLDILRFGPPTNWWCLMMETENGVYVHAGELSNFVNVMHSMATRVDLRRSHELYNGLVYLCERTKLCVSSVEPLCRRVPICGFCTGSSGTGCESLSHHNNVVEVALCAPIQNYDDVLGPASCTRRLQQTLSMAQLCGSSPTHFHAQRHNVYQFTDSQGTPELGCGLPRYRQHTFKPIAFVNVVGFCPNGPTRS